ncbi:MAG: hypothetical protein JRC87_08885 [Deltaproteobacteria bacterium]|nr:hypothetical protein [Deltaproteobacteria bacterium]MBW2659682.1 hypothetical protein [Deltaproteobacteria bacterium]
MVVFPDYHSFFHRGVAAFNCRAGF